MKKGFRGVRKLSEDYTPAGSRLAFIKKTVNQISDKMGKATTHSKALYMCSCGVEKEINTNNVKMGKVVSCGCFMKEEAKARLSTHGLTKTPLYRVWSDILMRCYNKKRDAYKYYGELGVTMCKEWENDFKSFYDWAIKNGWEKGLRIDKDIIPKKLGIPPIIYSPEMCSVVTHKENCNARKSNHLITFNGQTKNMTEWEAELFSGKEVIYNRLHSGWSEERALTQPLRKSPSKK